MLQIRLHGFSLACSHSRHFKTSECFAFTFFGTCLLSAPQKARSRKKVIYSESHLHFVWHHWKRMYFPRQQLSPQQIIAGCCRRLTQRRAFEKHLHELICISAGLFALERLRRLSHDSEHLIVVKIIRTRNRWENTVISSWNGLKPSVGWWITWGCCFPSNISPRCDWLICFSPLSQTPSASGDPSQSGKKEFYFETFK